MHLEKQRRGLKKFPISQEASLITSITASNNEIEFLPNITKYINLKRLALNNNKINKICASIHKLCTLNWLDLTRNNLKDLPIEMHKLNLLGLGLSENKFEEIPIAVFEMKNLQKFGFFSNFLTKIPVNLFNLKDLTKLDLSSNQLTEIPKEILQLKKLTWLNLSNNRLKTLPDLSSLVYLEELGLGNNCLTELPMLKNKNLKILPVYRNRLKEVHLCLENIKKLDFSENSIQYVNVYAPKLTYLNLKNNKIMDFKIYAHDQCFIDFRENSLQTVSYKFYYLMKNAKYEDNPFITQKKIKITHENSLKEMCLNKSKIFNFNEYIRKDNAKLIENFICMLYNKLKPNHLKNKKEVLKGEIINFSYRAIFYEKLNLKTEIYDILNNHFNNNCMFFPNMERTVKLLIDEFCYAALKYKHKLSCKTNNIESQSILFQPVICEDFKEMNTEIKKILIKFSAFPDKKTIYFLFEFLNMKMTEKSINLLNSISGFNAIRYEKNVRYNFCDNCNEIFYGKVYEKIINEKFQNPQISLKTTFCSFKCTEKFFF